MWICLGIKNKGYKTVFLSFVVILCIKKTCIAHIALTFINHLFWECLHINDMLNKNNMTAYNVLYRCILYTLYI